MTITVSLTTASLSGVGSVCGGMNACRTVAPNDGPRSGNNWAASSVVSLESYLFKNKQKYEKIKKK